MSAKEMPPGRMVGEAGQAMPTPDMGQSMPGGRTGDAARGVMPSGSMSQQAGNAPASGGGERVLVELRVPRGERSLALARASNVPGLTIDPDFEPVPMKPTGGGAGPEAAAAARRL